MEATLPDHITIPPAGKETIALIALVTNAVVAICVVLVLGAAVGAVGVPVKDGETEDIAPEKVAVVPVSAPPKVRVPVTAPLPLIVKLPAVPFISTLKSVPSQ